MKNHNFQVNLSGIIDLLSKHLYSSPNVFVRELLQNGIDAIAARKENSTSDFAGEIKFRILTNGELPVLICRDNGIGLNEEEAHKLLSVIGLSSKRDEFERQRSSSFIGQFGIGLLSGFLVSEEIVVKTRSVNSDGPVIEWRGSNTGVYTVGIIEEQDFGYGAEVKLTCKPGLEAYFALHKVRRLLKLFGECLPGSVKFQVNDEPEETINAPFIPWRTDNLNHAEERTEQLEYARATLDLKPLDCFPVESKAGGVKGVAYVLPYSPPPGTRQTHRVYLKQMLLSEQFDELLPSWVSFVKCVVNSSDLTPTASREELQQNETFFAAREELGECVHAYCRQIAKDDPKKLRQFLEVHQNAIRQLAVHDDRLYVLFIDHLEFETNKGVISFAEFRRRNSDSIIRYAESVDDFRQLKQTASAQSILLLNAGYGIDRTLVEKIPEFFPDLRVELLNAARISEKFDNLDEFEYEDVRHFLEIADETLKRYGCRAEIKKFYPAEVNALYSITEDGLLHRSAKDIASEASPLWASIMGDLDDEQYADQITTRLYFNYRNSLIKRLCVVDGEELLKLLVEICYVQALLSGHYTLGGEEQLLLNSNLNRLVELSIDNYFGESL